VGDANVATNEDASIDAAGIYPAPHPAMPQIGTLGGPVMAAPKIVAITFAGDSMQSQIADFVTKFGAATSYWSGATSEYKVGPIASATTITLNEMPTGTIDDVQIQSWLASEVATATDGGIDAAGDAGASLPPPDANTIYTIFYPDSVTITSQGGTGCQDFYGYHSDTQLPDQSYITYAVLPRCPPQAPGVSDIDGLAATTSHEFIEAATDPLALTNPAWSYVDDAHIAWEILGGGGEIGDVCAPFPGVFTDPPGLPYLVQHVWSNAAAAAGHDPCEPGGASPYFNSSPVLDDTIKVNDPMVGTFTTKGVNIAVGSSKAVELDLYSDAPTSGPWTISAIDLGSEFFGTAPLLSFKFDTTKGSNGSKVHVTIKVLAKGEGGVEMFWIQNQLGDVQTAWVGYVGS
jgi:hypothetical protein